MFCTSVFTGDGLRQGLNILGGIACESLTASTTQMCHTGTAVEQGLLLLSVPTSASGSCLQILFRS